MNYRFIASYLLCLFLLAGGIFALKFERKVLTPRVEAVYQSFSDPNASIQFFGDIMLDRNVLKNMNGKGLSYIFANTSTGSVFTGSDLLVANLEGPFAPKRIKTSKSIAFRFDPAFASQLKQLGFSAFDLANNHSNDMGSKNVIFTRTTLEKNGLHWFGSELDEGPAFTWFATTSDGTSLAVFGLHNTYHDLNQKKVLNALLKAKQQAQIVIVNVHWGVEYRPVSTQKQQDLAHWLIDHGADAVIGHHPHVIEEVEVYKGKPIFYSLGNFIFDQYFSTSTQQGLGVTLKISEGKVLSAALTPFFGIKSQVQPMVGDNRTNFLKNLQDKSRLGNLSLESGTINF